MKKENKQAIEELLSRSVSQILPSKEEFAKSLCSGKRLRIYMGADATGPQLHIGHATNFMLLERLRQLGHEIIVLFGDFTAMIGDPTDKMAARVQLSREKVEEHIASWTDQVEKVLDIRNAENPVRIVKNSEWLSKLDFSKIIELASAFTVRQMLERDMFEKRMKEEKPIYVHEFFYPLLQGYDSVALDVDAEIGGTDQTFNMLAGRTLQKKYNRKEKFVITTTLLENPVTGKKLMSKSEGGYIALNDSPREMFGKTMALPDEAIVSVFTDCTYIPLSEIAEIREGMKDGSLNPRDAKIRLAKSLVGIYHGSKHAVAEEYYFTETFSKKHIQEKDVPRFSVQWIPETKVYESVVNFMERVGFAESRSDARRKIEQGGVSLDGERVDAGNRLLSPETDDQKVIRVGKKHFAKIVFEERL